MLSDRDAPVTRKRSLLMARVRQRHSGPEIAVRRMAHSMGYRFRLHRSDLPGRPDVVFPGRKKVILVHGCFWHRHGGCAKATTPKVRVDFWNRKFANNMQRDKRVSRQLRLLGWKVLIIWECETMDPKILPRKLRSFLGPRA